MLKSLQDSASGDQSGPQPMEVDRIEIKARASTRAKRRTRAKAGGTIVLWALVAMAEDVEKAKAVATKDEKKVSRKARANPRARASARKARKARTRARWVHNSAEIAWSTASRAENVPTEMCSRWPTQTLQHPAEHGQQQQGGNFGGGGQGQAHASP